MFKGKAKNMLGSVSYVMIIMIFSRLLALVSTQVYMSFFGAGNEFLNIYSYAITVPNTIFNCFGTALSTVVIPIYAGHIANGRTKEADRFANNIITITSLLTMVLIIIGWGLSFVLPKFTSFNSPEAYSFAVKALMIMMPVMLFYGLNYIFQGILQSKGKFGWPAFVSVPSSLVVILYVIFLGDKFGVFGLLAATFIGLSLQAVILIFPLAASGFRYKMSFEIKDKDIVSAFKMTIPVMIGVSAYQLNMFYNVTMIANFEGMVTLLTYVQNIVVYMVLAFVYSITAVVYPKLTQSAATNKMDEYKQTLSGVLRLASMLLIPITAGFIVMRKQLLQLIAQWGRITDKDIEAACMLMVMYSIGILAIGLKEILDRALYAVKNTKISAANGFVIMAVNILLSLFLIRFIGAYGIPLAYSVSSIVGVCILLFMLKKKVGSYAGGLLKTVLRCAAAAAVMFVLVYFINIGLEKLIWQNGILARIIRLCIPAGAGVLIYGVMLLILGEPYVKDIVLKFKNKIFAR